MKYNGGYLNGGLDAFESGIVLRITHAPDHKNYGKNSPGETPGG